MRYTDIEVGKEYAYCKWRGDWKPNRVMVIEKGVKLGYYTYPGVRVQDVRSLSERNIPARNLKHTWDKEVELVEEREKKHEKARERSRERQKLSDKIKDLIPIEGLDVRPGYKHTVISLTQEQAEQFADFLQEVQNVR